MEFHQTYDFGTFGGKDELIRFWGQEVKGHYEAKCGQKSTFGTFCRHRTLNDDSLNWVGCVMAGSAFEQNESKVKVTRDQTKYSQKANSVWLISMVMSAVRRT